MAYAVKEIFGYKQHGVDDNGVAQGQFYATGHMPTFSTRLADVGIELAPELFRQRALTPVQAIGPMSVEDLLQLSQAGHELVTDNEEEGE